jgi:NADH-quinone oxidoreductase subunit H
VGGYHTEYSGIKLMMYLVADFLHMITASFLITILFLGGWHFWGLTGGINSAGGDLVTWPVAILRIIVLLAKVMGMILFFMLARWSWPRFRYDQLMDIAWKAMIPCGLTNLVIVAVWVEYGERLTKYVGLPWIWGLVFIGWIVIAASWLVFILFDPTSIDNRPRRSMVAPDREVEEIKQ